MKVRELIGLLINMDMDASVFFTMNGFENKYWVDDVGFHDGVNLTTKENVEFSDLAGAAGVMSVDGLTDEQVEALDAVITAEKHRIRDIQEGRL